MIDSGEARRNKARVLGPGACVTLEDKDEGTRLRVHIEVRTNGRLQVRPLDGTNVTVKWRPGANMELRAARPFGLFCYRTIVEGTTEDGHGVLALTGGPARRRQLRGYFRMKVRLGALIDAPESSTTPMLRVCNLSGSGVLLRDPEHRLSKGQRVRVGLPIGPSGEIVRLQARVVRVQPGQGVAGLCFEEITESLRLVVLRYLFKEHRKRKQRPRRSRPASITPIERS